MTASTKWFWLAFVVVIGFLCYILAPVLTPFVTAAILAYIADPLVDRLRRSNQADRADPFMGLQFLRATHAWAAHPPGTLGVTRRRINVQRRYSEPDKAITT